MNRFNKQFQQYSFYCGIFLLVGTYLSIGICDRIEDCNHSLLIYAIEMFILVACDIFYTWWWIHNGNASSIYRWMTILLYCLTFECAMELYARLLYLSDFNSFKNFIETPWWHGRTIPKMFTLIYIISLIIGRIIGSKFPSQVKK